jgi:hypothetical protein
MALMSNNKYSSSDVAHLCPETFEVMKFMKIHIVFVWVMIVRCSLMGGYQHFRGMYCPHLSVEVMSVQGGGSIFV